MGPTAVGLYAIGLIGVCSALPIQSVNTGKLCFPLELLPICKQAAGLMNGWKSWHELRILISRPRCSNVREKIAMWWWKLRRVVVSHEKLLLLRQWLLTLCSVQCHFFGYYFYSSDFVRENARFRSQMPVHQWEHIAVKWFQ